MKEWDHMPSEDEDEDEDEDDEQQKRLQAGNVSSRGYIPFLIQVKVAY